MKKLTLLLSAVLFSMMSFAATTVTMDFTSKEGLEKLGIAYPVTDAGNGAFCTNFEEGVAFTQEGVSISMDKSGNTVTRVWLTAKGVLDLRHYKNGVLKFTAPDGNIITKIELAGGNVAGFENVTDKVWQGGASTVDIIASASASTIKINTITLTLEAAAEDFVAPPTIQGTSNFEETTEVSISASEGLEVYYTLDGTTPTTASTKYTAPFTLSASTTVKAMAYDATKKLASDVVEKYLHKITTVTCAEAAALCATAVDGAKYIIRGYVTEIVTPYDSNYKNISFWMADAVGGGQVLQAFRAKPLNEGEENVQVGDCVEITGTLVLYTKEGSAPVPEVNAGGVYTIIGDPSAVKVEGLVYADAYYSEEGQYNFDLYKAYDEDTEEYTYPRVDVTVSAKNKLALNGTYELLEATYYASANESVVMGDTVGTLTVKNTDNEGNYSFSGSFVGTDGKTYLFDQILKVSAVDVDGAIELNEASVAKGKGTKEDPFSVADVLALDNSVAGKYYVRGYIIGHVDGASIESGLDTEAPFELSDTTKTQGTNLVLSSAMNDTTNLVPVQLPTGDLRATFNLVENPDMCGKEVLVYGSLEAYFKIPGIKSPESIELIDLPSDVENAIVGEAPVKVIENGQLFIIRGENVYTILGAQVK